MDLIALEVVQPVETTSVEGWLVQSGAMCRSAQQHSDLYTNQVYSQSVARTNIDIDNALVAKVMQRYGLSTKREAVDFALRRLAGPTMTREELLAMQGAGLIEHPVNEHAHDASHPRDKSGNPK